MCSNKIVVLPLLLLLQAMSAVAGNLVSDGAFNNISSSPGSGWWVGASPSFNSGSAVYNYFNINSNRTDGLFETLEPGVNQSGTPNTSVRSIVNESDGTSPAVVFSFPQPLTAGTYRFSIDLSSRFTHTITSGQPNSFYSRANVALFNADTATDNVAILVDALDHTIPVSPTSGASDFNHYSGTFTVTTTNNYRLLFRVLRGTNNNNLDYYIDRVAVEKVPPTVNISIQKINNKTHYTPGSTGSYVITVTNTGPDTAENIVVTDSLPSGTTLSNAWSCNSSVGSSCTNSSGGSVGSGSVSVMGSIVSGGTLTITVPMSYAADPANY